MLVHMNNNQPNQNYKLPQKYHVVLTNDDNTPTNFITDLLRRIFRLSEEEVSKKITELHIQNYVALGKFTFEIAETKLDKIVKAAELHKYPLYADIEATQGV